MMVDAELAAGAAEVFASVGDMAKLTLRRYTKGFTSGSNISGKMTPAPIGGPMVVPGILAKQRGGETGSETTAFFKNSAFGSVGPPVANAGQHMTVQGPDGEKFLISGKIRPFGPNPKAPLVWLAKVVTGEGASGH